MAQLFVLNHIVSPFRLAFCLISLTRYEACDLRLWLSRLIDSYFSTLYPVGRLYSKGDKTAEDNKDRRWPY